MSVKDLIAQVRAKANTAGEDGKVDAGEIKSILVQIEREAIDLEDNLKSANYESMTRKDEIKKLKSQIETDKETLADLESKVNDETLKQEVESLRGFKDNWMNVQRNNFQSEFSKISKHPKFEKAKTKFILPETTEENTDYDFTKLSNEEMEKNINILSDLNQLEYFDNTQNPNPKVFGNQFKQPINDNPKITSQQDLTNFWNTKLKEI